MQRYGEEYAVTSLDKDTKVATLANGQSIQYDALVSTMPLDITLRWLGQPEWADTLSHRWGTGHHPPVGVPVCFLMQEFHRTLNDKWSSCLLLA